MAFFDIFKTTCRDATYFHGKKEEGKLSFTEMIGMRIHLLYCGLCRLFFTQMDELEKQTHDISQSEKVGSSLDASAKAKMKQALEEEMKK